MAMTIHAFDPTRRTNARLMQDCLILGYVREPVLDMTYGEGKFWKGLGPLQVIGNDLNPSKGDVHFDFRRMPDGDRSYPTVVFDPPYRLGGTPSTPDFDSRYGLDEYRGMDEMEALIRAGTAEAVRIADHFAIIKVQDHVSSTDLRPLTTWVIEEAHRSARVRLADSLHVVGGRAQPKGRAQKRARHGYSTALVFRILGRKRTK